MFEPTVQRCDVKEFPYLEISVKFGFSKKATKIKKIFTVDLTLTT